MTCIAVVPAELGDVRHTVELNWSAIKCQKEKHFNNIK